MKKIKVNQHARLSIAPMMDWTDRHCRYLHRQMSRRVWLYTEMVTAAALIHGPADRLLRHSPEEHPLVLQLGGSDPADLAQAARIGADAGYAEINLNCGCPSDRVQSGAFGACLMREPALVADCVSAMRAAVSMPVTVKCRIGVDDQDPSRALPAFLEAVANAGCQRVIIHARKAWLQGLSPRENRDIPPLDYGLAAAMTAAFPDLAIELNGGIASLEDAQAQLSQGFAGVMIGRAAYQTPTAILPGIDPLYGEPPGRDAFAAVEAMLPYIEAACSAGTRLNQITRHMLGLFAGRPGARRWRRLLSEEAGRPGAGVALVQAALAAVVPDAA
ncbi:MAG: tRNA dihydrouridine(20/20a) synthase DusA [Pseudomonadota bacterium]